MVWQSRWLAESGAVCCANAGEPTPISTPRHAATSNRAVIRPGLRRIRRLLFGTMVLCPRVTRVEASTGPVRARAGRWWRKMCQQRRPGFNRGRTGRPLWRHGRDERAAGSIASHDSIIVRDRSSGNVQQPAVDGRRGRALLHGRDLLRLHESHVVTEQRFTNLAGRERQVVAD